MSRFLSSRLSNLTTYTPGEQPKDTEYIKLNTNEAPYPPSPLVFERINEAQISKLNLYPDPECTVLGGKIAKLYNVKSENIFISNGSDEILSFAFMAFCDSKKGIVFPDITYGFYKVFGDLYGIPYKQIPLKDDLTIEPSDYYGIGKNIVIANPNAPSGRSIPLTMIENMLMTNPNNIVIIDEAYVDFGGESSIGLVEKYDNLLVVQTYSKSRHLAGARLGFAIASKEIIEDLNKIKYSTNPYNINRLSQVAGEAAIDDDEYYKKHNKEVITTREYTRERLNSFGFTVIPSDTNFLFAKMPGIDGCNLYNKLKEKKILVRNFKDERIKDYIRISIGTKEQMDAFINTLEQIIREEL